MVCRYYLLTQNKKKIVPLLLILKFFYSSMKYGLIKFKMKKYYKLFHISLSWNALSQYFLLLFAHSLVQI